jgi:hypothetical protein
LWRVDAVERAHGTAGLLYPTDLDYRVTRERREGLRPCHEVIEEKNALMSEDTADAAARAASEVQRVRGGGRPLLVAAPYDPEPAAISRDAREAVEREVGRPD